MRRATFFFGAVVALFAAQPVMAQLTDQNFRGGRTGDLAALCAPSEQDPFRLTALAYCQGYFVAAGQYHDAVTAESSMRRPIFCLPNPSPTFDQARISFANWAKAHPEYANERAIDGLTRFAAESYPCPSNPTPRHHR
jgi:Rap1a immunity proteins